MNDRMHKELQQITGLYMPALSAWSSRQAHPTGMNCQSGEVSFAVHGSLCRALTGDH